MTFSLLARDPATGALGMVVASSSPAVAARCLHLRSGVGAVASQNVTNPALGAVVLDALAGGLDADAALAHAVRSEAHPAHRQLVVVDAEGRTALHSGSQTLGVHAGLAASGAAAAGNLLAGADVIDALLEGYRTCDAAPLEERLLAGLAQALAAGGEAGPVRSAGLAVVEDVPWRTSDLRVDWHDDPIGELYRLWQVWAPHKADYRTRGLDPTRAPSYGVPGDE